MLALARLGRRGEAALCADRLSAGRGIAAGRGGVGVDPPTAVTLVAPIEGGSGETTGDLHTTRVLGARDRGCDRPRGRGRRARRLHRRRCPTALVGHAVATVDERALDGRPATSEPPTTPPTSEPPTTPPTSDPLAGVVSVAVHPAVGIARVGNSADSFFFGPELPGSLPVAPGGFKDATGAIARQAARFRIFGYDAAGAVVREITAADADITWTVSVANTKAAWYDFDRAMDLPVAAAVKRRNADVTGADRERLVVAAGERSISGPAAAPVALDAGRFLDEPVPLGELLTDELGRLVFLPAEGRGYSPGQAPLTSFANNDGWSDDTCDGPVLATVTIGGRTLQAEPGWVVVAPPNYGPGLRAGLITGVRLVAPRLGHLRRRRADRGRRQLPRRHPADPQPHRRHAMGQRRLPRLERLGQRGRLPGAGPARSTRRSDPGERRAAPADVRAVPQPGLRRRATGRGAADVR